MADRGRYDDDMRYSERGRGDYDDDRRGGGFSRNSGSIFGSGSRDRGRDDDSRSERGGGSRGGGAFFGGGRGGSNPMSHDRQDDRRDSRYGGGREMQNRRGGDDKHYGPDDDRQGLPVNETSRLIASNKVEGTAVYGSDGHRLGTIYNFMVNKFSGKVEYAVMAYGGMLGMGQRYYPLPWQILSYDTREGGYHIEMTERDLRDAPSFDRETEPKFDNNYGDRVNSWYGVAY